MPPEPLHANLELVPVSPIYHYIWQNVSYMSVWPVLSNITLMEKEHTLKRRFLKQIHLRLKMIILHMDRDCSFKIPLERELAYSVSMKPL